MAEVSGLVESVRTHMIVREGDQGWTDAQMIMSLILLNIAGGECVDDPRSSRGQALRVLEKDEGLGRVLRTAMSHNLSPGSPELLCSWIAMFGLAPAAAIAANGTLIRSSV